MSGYSNAKSGWRKGGKSGLRCFLGSMATVMADSGRTVVVSGVPAVLEFSRMVDKLTIHFQSRRISHGGDVEVVKYPTNMVGVAFVTFDQAEGKVVAVCGGKFLHAR